MVPNRDKISMNLISCNWTTIWFKIFNGLSIELQSWKSRFKFTKVIIKSEIHRLLVLNSKLTFCWISLPILPFALSIHSCSNRQWTLYQVFCFFLFWCKIAKFRTNNRWMDEWRNSTHATKSKQSNVGQIIFLVDILYI